MSENVKKNHKNCQNTPSKNPTTSGYRAYYSCRNDYSLGQGLNLGHFYFQRCKNRAFHNFLDRSLCNFFGFRSNFELYQNLANS